MDSAGLGRISRVEMKASDFARQLFLVAEPNEKSEADAVLMFFETNKSQGYRWFSFESAFVLWRMFCELDSDNDGLLSKNDLRHYGDVCLT